MPAEATITETVELELLDLLTTMLHSLAQRPVHVSVSTDAGLPPYMVFVVRVESSDRGRVIGKQGKMLESLRTILLGGARAYAPRIKLEIV